MIYARGCLQRAAATTVQAMTASSQVHRGEAASNFSVTLAHLLLVVVIVPLLLLLVLVAYCRSHGKYRRSPKRKSLASHT